MGTEIQKAAAAMGRKGGKSKSEAKRIAAQANMEKARANIKPGTRRTGPNCTHCKRLWADCDASPCR